MMREHSISTEREEKWFEEEEHMMSVQQHHTIYRFAEGKKNTHHISLWHYGMLIVALWTKHSEGNKLHLKIIKRWSVEKTNSQAHRLRISSSILSSSTTRKTQLQLLRNAIESQCNLNMLFDQSSALLLHRCGTAFCFSVSLLCRVNWNIMHNYFVVPIENWENAFGCSTFAATKFATKCARCKADFVPADMRLCVCVCLSIG